MHIKKLITEEKVNYTKECKYLLDTLQVTEGKTGKEIPILILIGSKSRKVYRYRNKEIFGKGSNHTTEWWKIFFKKILQFGEIISINRVIGERTYITFGIGKKGLLVLNGKLKVMIKEIKYEKKKYKSM